MTALELRVDILHLAVQLTKDVDKGNDSLDELISSRFELFIKLIGDGINE